MCIRSKYRREGGGGFSMVAGIKFFRQKYIGTVGLCIFIILRHLSSFALFLLTKTFLHPDKSHKSSSPRRFAQCNLLYTRICIHPQHILPKLVDIDQKNI